MAVPSFLNYTLEGATYDDGDLIFFISGNFAYFLLGIIIIILLDFFVGD